MFKSCKSIIRNLRMLSSKIVSTTHIYLRNITTFRTYKKFQTYAEDEDEQTTYYS